jgi:hypothetical protein
VRRRAIGLGPALVVLLATTSVGAQEDAPPPPDDDVRAELARQRAAIEALAAKVAAPPAVRISGYAQVDWVTHDQQSENEINGSTGQPLNQDRFTLRRGHVRVDAERGLVSAALEIDANTTNGPQVRPIDAEVSLRWPFVRGDGRPWVMATMGLMRIPFGFEVQESDNVRPFLERATMLQALFPGEFDLGARLRGGWRFVDWAIAVMNGNPIGSKTFPDLDPVRTKDLVGRIGIDVEVVPKVRFQAGASAETGLGFHAGTPTTKDTLVWQDANGDGVVQPNEVQVIPGSAAVASQTFKRYALGGDARLIVSLAPLGDLALRAEVVRAQNLDRGLEVADPIGAGHDLRELGWSLGGTQEITPWAMIGARYDYYDPDADASEQQAANLVPLNRSYGMLALMAMARYETARLLVEYDVKTNALGRDASGAPTTLAANALTIRGQVSF